MSGPHRDPVHGDRAKAPHDRRGVVAAAGTRPGDHQYDIRA
jgi:hypothetical protein